MNREQRRNGVIDCRIEEAAEGILEPWPEVTVDLDAGGDDLSGQFIQPLLLCSSLFHFRLFGAG